ncbi:hypothetical protein BOTBODRAFT_466154 [Botryobasidium botryosum FD-172 SS1]|uniref:Wax synthase domain-containing protein n=1 Tax=Botryobasidium botryosum (strain FD-172 SS1) TaxID=930990 RepID=A0A067M8R8_BOTB1|nr:hypothetical protein BOTBODRAFT_466154 [Botryobasidium botryosum FD-172 SS1]
MCFAVRGIGWDFGTGSGLYVASTSRNVKNRSQFLFQTLTSAFQYYLSVDLLNTFLKLIPGVGTPEGGSIYISILPPAQRALMAFMITFTTGLLVPGLLGLGYDIGTFFAVLVLRHDPAAWPPLFDKPWGRTSIHAHWARGWHNLLRQTFFILGGFPFQAFLGRVGLEFGTFFGSALYHYLAMYSIGRTDLRVLVFFTAQFFGMRLEKWWRRSTGYAVGGPLGFLWLFVWMTGTGQIYSEALMTAGVGGGTIIPSWLSIGQRWALPYMKAALTNTFPVLFPPLAA